MPEATATTAAATTATTAAAATTATSTTTAAAAPAWHGFAPDAPEAAYIANKGWQGPQDVIKSYQGSEKLIGRDPSTLLVMPRADDPNGFLAVMDKLGRPADPSKYEFSKPDEGMAVDEKYQEWARGTFHKLGLPAQTVKALTGEHNAYIKGVLAQQEKDYQLQVATDKKALAAEWRDGAERKFAAASAAAKGLGFSPEVIDAIEREVGYAKTVKMFADLGTRMGEDGFVSGTVKPSGFGGMTPDEARSEWDKMKNDPIVYKALSDPTHPDNKKHAATQKKLFDIMYPK